MNQVLCGEYDLEKSDKIRAYLESNERNYDPGARMLRVVWHGPGYHTTVSNGALVHPTRDSLTYALALLEEGSPGHVQRAQGILNAVLPLQDVDPCSRTYGVWPWLLEEPLARMSPPDLNWADFCGVRLAHLLARYGDLLDRDVRRETEAALRAAAYAIFRRNVGPHYTNIALLGAVAVTVAGELLNDGLLLDYGRRRLGRLVEYTHEHGGFNEYNSPNYGLVVLTEAERGLLLVKDFQSSRSLETLREACWRMFASLLHLPTGQLCGPHARSYQDRIGPEIAARLEQGFGCSLFHPRGMKPRKNDLIDPGLIPSLSAPDAIRHKLTANVSETVEHQDYVRSDVAQERRRGTVWRGDEACLGSVNLDNSWSQRRPVLGYWRVDDDVAVLRVRIMHSGRDFASGLIHAAQERNELLVAGTLATNLGDSHPILDRPEEGVFDVRDFSLCVELGGPGAMVQAMGQDRFALGAGDWQAVVRPAFARISGCEVRWEIASEADRAVVRAVVNAGRAFKLHPQALEEAIIGLHLSVQRKPETVPGELPGELPGAMVELGETSRGGDVVLKATSVQRRLTLCAPRRPGEYREFCPARPRRALQATADR